MFYMICSGKPTLQEAVAAFLESLEDRFSHSAHKICGPDRFKLVGNLDGGFFDFEFLGFSSTSFANDDNVFVIEDL